MKIRYKAILITAFISGLAVLSGCGCKDKNTVQYKINLEIWGFDDTSDTFNEIIGTYKKINPNITNIEYKKLAADSYRKELIDAMAAGQGPDIFVIHNTWLTGFSDKIATAPKEIINEQKLRKDFVDVVADDFLDQGQVWAVPLSVDSLGLYYNKDLFNAASITSPPKNWDDFVADAGILTKIDNVGEISRSGASLGTAYNINRSTDILNLMMLQNGTKMTEKDGSVSFDQAQIIDGKTVSPGENALSFYTDFARAGSSKYTWNRNMHYSIDAFSEGNLAMMFNYSWHIKTIENKSPKLNFAIAPIPQFTGSAPANYANYWAYGVAKNKANIKNSVNATNDNRVREAWKFLAFLAAKPEAPIQIQTSVAGTTRTTNSNYDPALVYANKTGKPAARRDIIEIQKADSKIGVFVNDNLIAKSWKQADSDAVELTFSEMIDQINRGQFTVREALQTAAKRVGQMAK
jgi:ABC-type glycerol-3-phosphate transport system substrate-binding protein